MKRITAVILLFLVAGCGLATSDAERITRAEEQMVAGDYRSAMIELKNVLASDGNNATARTLLATVSLGLGDVLAAEKELQRAAELDAPEATIRSINLEILLAKRDFVGILSALGSEIGGLTQEQQWSYRGEALLGLHKSEEAMATYEEWWQSDPSSSDASIGLARAEFLQDDIDAAIARLETITAATPDKSEAWQSLGAARFRNGNHEGAETALRNAVDTLQPQADIRRYSLMLAGLIEAQLIQDKKDDARRNLNRLSGVAAQAPSTMFLAARLARADGDYALASRHLQTLLTISPDSSQAQLFLASMQLMQGNFAQAERLLHRVITVAPDNIQARKLLARAQLQQTQPAGAIEALAPALESGEDDPDIYAILAQANMQGGDTKTAIRQFRKAAELAPYDMEAKLNLASAYLQAGEISLAQEVLDEVPEGAGAMFRREQLMIAGLVAENRIADADAIATQLLSQADNKEAATLIVANYYQNTDRNNDARTVLQDFLKIQPDSINGSISLARIELSEGNNDTAHSLLQSVVAVDENNLNALLGLAHIARKTGEEADVIRLLQRAAEFHPQALGPRVLLAGEYLKAGDSQAAEQVANELVSIGFRNSYVSTVVANIFSEAGRTDDALYHFQQATRLNPNSAKTQLGMARAYISAGQTVEAREALNRALTITPGWRPAMLMLALVEVRQGQLDDAQLLVEEYRKLHSDDVAGMVLEGEIHLYKKEFELAAQAFGLAVENGAGRSSVLRQYQALVDGAEPRAEGALQDWLREKPEDIVVRTFLAQHYQVSNVGESAIREYEKVLEYAPDNANVLNNLAWQYQQSGDLERAARLAEAAYKINPKSGSIADTLGWIYWESGQIDKSAKLLSDASRLSPENGEIQYHYAVVLNSTGDKEEARRLLQDLKDRNAQFTSRKLADDLLVAL